LSPTWRRILKRMHIHLRLVSGISVELTPP
jgi:hypothetical protein